jgi:rSAM/selenodomain-associated transferase 1
MTLLNSVRNSKQRSLGGIIAAISGAVLFVYFIQRAGAGDVIEGIQRLGWVFLIVVCLGGMRHLVRAAAWLRCMEGGSRLELRHVFQAVIVGDALGNLTPLSLIISEPAKVMFLRDRAPSRQTFPALAVENLFYTFSAILMIACGLVSLFLVLQEPGQLWLVTTFLISSLVLLIVIAHGLIWRRISIASSTLLWFKNHNIAPEWTGQAAARVRSMEQNVYRLYPRDRIRLLTVAVLEFLFHFLAVLEIYVVLSIVSDLDPTILDVVIFESTNRLITILFKFVPLRIGVDEAGTGLFANLLAFGTTTGVTLAIVRKARMLVWISIGIGLLVRRGFSVGQLLDETQQNVAIVVMARSLSSVESPKTRLSNQIPSDKDRRRLYTAFLSDTITACRKIKEADFRLASTPNGDTAGFLELGVNNYELVIQRGADLGSRECSIFEDLFKAGFNKVVVIGSDMPTLPIIYIRQAIALIDRSSVVLGPSEDGGYYLIGLAAPDQGVALPDLFTKIRWSTKSAFNDTLVAAKRSDIHVRLVPGWYDVDDGDGLSRLRCDLNEPDIQKRAPATDRIVRELFIEKSSKTFCD